MLKRATFQWLLGATLLQVGCTMGYNGAWFAMQDPATAQAYEQFARHRMAQQAIVSRRDRIQSSAVRFEGPYGKRSVSLARSEKHRRARSKKHRGPNDRKVELASDQAAPHGARPPGFLYGLLTDQRQDALSSPMDGTANIQQVTFATEGADFDPAIDPTGKWLVYASTQHRPTPDLYVKAVTGTTVRQLTNDPSSDATPTFSPDGKWVAYASDRSGNWDIYLVSADGGPSQQLTNSPSDEIHPSFSPDGKQIVYCSLGSQSGQWEMVVIDIESPSTPKFIGLGLFPQWSPNESRIVYQRARERGSKLFGIWVMRLINGEGVGPTQIASSSNAAAITPRWSADGKSIVFCTIVEPDSDLQQGTPVQSDIWIINDDGSGRANLTRSRFANLQPVWARHGTIFFVSNRGQNGTENVWAMRTEAALSLVRGRVEKAATAIATVPTP